MPRAMFQMPPVFFSILGAPSCGKSYFLASMTWMLRKTLPRHFAMAFGDADPMLNHQLNEYEELQFLNPDQDRLVAIRKTEEQGDLYDTVRYSDQTVRYPRPFVFTLKPLEGHPNHAAGGNSSRALCLYDNAGESFLPGADTGTAPVTRHLAHSRCLLFLFDPTQDLRFRKACMGKTADPQMQDRAARLVRERAVRQDQILLEATERTRRYANIGPGTRNSRPLVVVVTKYDAWSSLVGDEPLTPPWVKSSKSDLCALDLQAVERRSQKIRKLLWELTPEIVSAAESFTKELVFIPVSAMGRSPEVDPETGAFGIRPRDISPLWAEVPLLYGLGKWVPGLVPYRKDQASPKDVGR